MIIIRSGLRKYIERLPWLFYKFRIIQRIFDSDNTFARLSDVAGDQGGVQSVTGDGVGGTPEDVVMTFPTAAEIGAIEDAPSDGKQYVRKDANWDEVSTGTSNLADVLAQGNSAGDLKITNLADGVDAGDAVNKSQLDALESPFKVIDVTQLVYSDIAINVKDFGNTQAGMTYQEGAIDFGVSRDSIHEMGLYSFKAGAETTASGIGSFASGIGSTASGGYSFAVGSSTASGGYSFAVGSSTASGESSFAVGSSTASGEISFAVGSSTASGESSFAVGRESESLGDFSFSQGFYAKSTNHYSFSFGNNVTSSGFHSTAFGQSSTASGNNSTAFGNGTVANEYASLSIGRYTKEGTIETLWTNGSPIFKVGNGTGSNDRKNAYTLYNDGRSEQEKDMEVTTIGQGFVLKSPDGTRWRITVDNDGSLITTEL